MMSNPTSIKSYHEYYIKYKQHLAKWTKRGEPYWYGKERLELRTIYDGCRAKVANLETSENQILREDLKNLTQAYYMLINRIKKLSEENLHNANILNSEIMRQVRSLMILSTTLVEKNS